MRKSLLLLWAGLALMAAAAVLSMPLFGRKEKHFTDYPPRPVGDPIAAGFKVHVDPATGKIVPPPAKPQAEPGAKALLPSSHEGLVEEAGTTAAGGFKVDVRGKFRSAVMLQTGPDSKPRITCVDAASTESRPAE